MKHANLPVVLRLSRLRLWWLYINHDPALGMSVLVGLVAGFFCSLGFFLTQWDIALLVRGERATGTVLQKWIASAPSQPNDHLLAHGGRRRGPKPRVSYEFTDGNGGRRTGEGILDRQAWDALQPGQTLLVVYLPEDPEHNRPSEAVWSVLPPILIFVVGGGLFAVFGLRGALGRLQWIREQIRLLQTGRATVAMITPGPKPEPTADSEYQYAVTDDAGRSALHPGRLSAFVNVLKRLPPNEPLLVAYDPDLPLRHALDVFQARPESPVEVLRDCRYLDK